MIAALARYFTDDFTIRTLLSQVAGLNKSKRMSIDEVYQSNPLHICILYMAKVLKNNVQIFGAGAWDQIPAPSPNNDAYDLKLNTFFLNSVFDANEMLTRSD